MGAINQQHKNMLDVAKPIGLAVNREQASLLRDGLDLLPDIHKHSVVYKALRRDLDNIITIWDRRIKNAKLMKESKAAEKVNAKTLAIKI